VSGRISYFGDAPGFNDPMAGSRTASGISTYKPGLAVRPGGSYTSGRSTLGGYWEVTLPNRRKVVLQQTDIGPHERTGRRFDFTTSSLARLGYTRANFPTNAVITGRYLGRRRPR
jgi:hypothetical protein